MTDLISYNPLEKTFSTTGQPRASGQVAVDDPDMRYEPGSSEWWLLRLTKAMTARNLDLGTLRDYYLGENDTWKFADRAHKDTFGDRFKNLRANFAQPIVEVPEQRMRVIGLTYWDDDAASDKAWDIWLENQLEAASSEAHLNALSTGIAPVFVDPWRKVTGNVPLITVEDPLQVLVEHDPADPRTRLAALKRWTDDDGKRIAILYLPDRIEWWRTTTKDEDGQKVRWERLEGEGGDNPLGVVPMVELRNAPRARAEHAGVTSELDRYATVLYNMATAGHFMAYPQRWATGVDAPAEGVELSDDGVPLTSEPAAGDAGPDTTVTSESPDSEFGAFPPTDLTGFIRQLHELRSDMATISHTPHRLLIPPPSSVPPSGESVRLADAPLTHKIERKFTTLGNGWETVIRLAFLAMGDQVLARRMDLDTEWADPELRTESEHMDALTKMQAMGVPQEVIWRRMGATPQQIRRWRTLPPPPSPEPAIPDTGDTDSDD